MASKILIMYLRLFIFIGMISSINAKSFNYQPSFIPKNWILASHSPISACGHTYSATRNHRFYGSNVRQVRKISAGSKQARNPMAAVNRHLVK